MGHEDGIAHFGMLHILENKKKFFELKSRGYRDGIERKGQGRDGLYIMELLSVQCLQVDDVIPILSPIVYCGFGRCCSQRFAWWKWVYKVYLSCGFQ